MPTNQTNRDSAAIVAEGRRAYYGNPNPAAGDAAAHALLLMLRPGGAARLGDDGYICVNGVRTDPHSFLWTLRLLHRIGRSLRNRYAAACSYAWAARPAYGARTDRLEARAIRVAESVGLTVDFCRDPRGWPLVVATDASHSVFNPL